MLSTVVVDFAVDSGHIGNDLDSWAVALAAAPKTATITTKSLLRFNDSSDNVDTVVADAAPPTHTLVKLVLLNKSLTFTLNPAKWDPGAISEIVYFSNTYLNVAGMR